MNKRAQEVPVSSRYERALRVGYLKDAVKNLHWSDLLMETMASHCDPDCAEYNGCENSPCGWCLAAYLNLKQQGIDYKEDEHNEEEGSRGL